MKKIFSIALISIIILVIQGCGISKSYTYEQPIQENKSNIEVTLTPINPSMIAGYSGFILKVNNNSNDDMEIDWNKTYFIDNGRTNGTFMFEGIVYKDRNNQKASDIVFSKNQFSKAIYPNNYAVFSTTGGYGGWQNNGFGTGEFGIYLTLKVNDKEIKEKYLVKIKER